MLTLHLIRHGETNWNAERRCQGQSDSVLSEQGRLQATALRPAIEALSISAIYTSSNLRTRQTTEILARNLELPVTALDELREIRLGHWETKLWDDITPINPDEAREFREKPDQFALPGAETFVECRDRGVRGIERILSEQSSVNTSADILVVSHGAILKALMTHYTGMPLSQLWVEPSLGNCSHSVLEANSNGNRRVTHIAGIPIEETAWMETRYTAE